MAIKDNKIRIEVYAPVVGHGDAPVGAGRADESVLQLARLIGRQIAREQFERQQVSIPLGRKRGQSASQR